MTHRKAKAGYLYVVATQSGTVKFGISVNPKDRIKAHRYSLGRVSPITYEWTSDACGGYREIEKILILRYGEEYVQGVDHASIRLQIEVLVREWNDKYPGYYEIRNNIVRCQEVDRTSAGELQRANFVVSNDDDSLRAYFLIPVLCAQLGATCIGMPDDVRDHLANSICDYSDDDLSSFLANFFAGGERRKFALDNAGISEADFFLAIA